MLDLASWDNRSSAALPVAALAIDLDNFKSINDVHGFPTGDSVLAAAADRLRDLAGTGDILGRNGGDEFVVVLTAPQRARQATNIAGQVRQTLAAPFEIGADRIHLTASVGCAVHPRGSVSTGKLLHHADIALWSAKKDGRDQTTMFDVQQAKVATRLLAETELVRQSLDEDRLTMLYQPIVDRNGQTIGAEALARCRSTDGTLIPPRGFYSGAVQGSFVSRLDRAAFQTSCADAARLTTAFPNRGLFVSCNFSPKSLAQSDFAPFIFREIERAGIDPRRICIEITETAAFEAGPRIRGALDRLAQAGVRIALDDFGTGFSSLSHLTDLPLTDVKIDRSFVAMLHERSTHWTIARAAVELASALGLAVIAEGVETQQQVDEVCALGIRQMQGWKFASAMPMGELIDFVEPALTA